MVNKKGMEVHGFVMKLILAIVGAMIVISFLVFFQLRSGGDVSDGMCQFSNSVRGAGSGIFKEIEQSRPGAVMPKTPRFCKTQLVKIQPDDFTKCDPQLEADWFIPNKRADAVRACAAQQIAELAYRCWKMNGEGAWNPDSWVCFRGELVGSIEPGSLKDTDVQSEYEDKVRDEICPPATGEDNRKIVPKSGPECKSVPDVSKKLAELMTKYVIWKSVSEYYSGGLQDVASNCARRAEGMTDEQYGLAKEKLADEFVFKVLPEKEYDEQLRVIQSGNSEQSELDNFKKTYIKYGTDYENQLGSKIDETIATDKMLCSGQIKNLINYAFVGKFESNENTATAQNNLRSYIERSLEYTDEQTSSDKDIRTELDKLTDDVIKIAPELPDFAAIDEQFLQYVMKTYNILGENRKYSSVLPGYNLRFIKQHKIKVGEMFEVGFCDPNMGDILSGVGALFECTLDSFKSLQLLAKQQILVAKGGQSTYASRTENPYPNMCNLFNMHITDRVWFTDWRALCRGAARFALGERAR